MPRRGVERPRVFSVECRVPSVECRVPRVWSIRIVERWSACVQCRVMSRARKPPVSFRTIYPRRCVNLLMYEYAQQTPVCPYRKVWETTSSSYVCTDTQAAVNTDRLHLCFQILGTSAAAALALLHISANVLDDPFRRCCWILETPRASA